MIMNTAISRKAVGKKKHQNVRDKTERWSGYSLEFAYWPKGNLQVCFFCTWKICFSSLGPIFVALLLLLHVFE